MKKIAERSCKAVAKGLDIVMLCLLDSVFFGVKGLSMTSFFYMEKVERSAERKIRKFL